MDWRTEWSLHSNKLHLKPAPRVHEIKLLPRPTKATTMALDRRQTKQKTNLQECRGQTIKKPLMLFVFLLFDMNSCKRLLLCCCCCCCRCRCCSCSSQLICLIICLETMIHVGKVREICLERVNLCNSQVDGFTIASQSGCLQLQQQLQCMSVCLYDTQEK